MPSFCFTAGAKSITIMLSGTANVCSNHSRIVNSVSLLQWTECYRTLLLSTTLPGRLESQRHGQTEFPSSVYGCLIVCCARDTPTFLNTFNGMGRRSTGSTKFENFGSVSGSAVTSKYGTAPTFWRGGHFFHFFDTAGLGRFVCAV